MDKLIKKIRRNILQASFEVRACHLGGALSAVEILVALYFKILKENDIFLFSKASGASALYAVLAEKGYFPKEKLAQYLHNYPLASKEVPGVIHSVGSLGMGFGVAAGMALADRNRKVYCLISDGELDEGSTWEAVKFAGQKNLDNLMVVLDYNGITACQWTNLEPLKDKFLAFNWMAHIVDGHDIDKIETVLRQTEKPLIIIAHTVKGWGVSFMRNQISWHYKNLTENLLKQALKENE